MTLAFPGQFWFNIVLSLFCVINQSFFNDVLPTPIKNLLSCGPKTQVKMPNIRQHQENPTKGKQGRKAESFSLSTRHMLICQSDWQPWWKGHLSKTPEAFNFLDKMNSGNGVKGWPFSIHNSAASPKHVHLRMSFGKLSLQFWSRRQFS